MATALKRSAGLRRLPLLVVMTFAAGSLVGAQQPSEPLDPDPVRASIGVVRADGVLLPLAAIRNNVWRALAVVGRSGGSRMTPEARRLGLDGWVLAPPSASPRPFKLAKPMTVAYECSNTEVFDTSLASRKRLVGAETTRTLGLAIQGNATVQPAVHVAAATDVGSRGVRDAIAGTLQTLETQRFDALRGTNYAPELRRFSLAERAKRPVRFNTLFHHKKGLVDWYYFEAEKDYSDVGIVFFVSGWMAGFGAESYITDVHAVVAGSSDELKGAPTNVLGVIPGRYSFEPVTWVMATYTNIDLVYTLFQIGGHDEYSVKRVLDVSANHCLP